MKIAIIGAGSIGFTRRLFADIMSVPELQDVEVALTDIDETGLANITELLKRTVKASGLPTRITRHHGPAAAPSTAPATS